MTNDHEDLSVKLRDNNWKPDEAITDTLERWAAERLQAADLLDRQASALAKAEGERDEAIDLALHQLEAATDEEIRASFADPERAAKEGRLIIKAAMAEARAQSAEARAEKLAAVVSAARNMPRRTPAPGGCATEHQFTIEAGTVWALDLALSALDHVEAAREALSPPLGRGGKGIGVVTSPVEPGSGALPSSGVPDGGA